MSNDKETATAAILLSGKIIACIVSAFCVLSPAAHRENETAVRRLYLSVNLAAEVWHFMKPAH